MKPFIMRLSQIERGDEWKETQSKGIKESLKGMDAKGDAVKARTTYT